MKRRLMLHRETVRNLEHQNLGQIQGGALSGAAYCIPSLIRTGCVTCQCPTQAGTSC